MPKTHLKYDVYFPGERAAGLLSYHNNVEVIVDYDMGGESGEFAEAMRAFLAEWFDGAHIGPYEGPQHPRYDGPEDTNEA